MNNHTTYALLVQSQEKRRAIMETAVYITGILSVVVAIFQFAGQPTPDPFAASIHQRNPRRLCRIMWRQCWIRNLEISRGDMLRTGAAAIACHYDTRNR